MAPREELKVSRAQLEGWNCTLVITSVSSSMLSGLMSTTSAMKGVK